MKKLIISLCVAFALASCTEYEQDVNTPVTPGEVAEVQLDWSVSDLVAGDALTRTIPSDMGTGATYDDARPMVRNMWIIQFDGATTASKMIGAPRFLATADLPEVSNNNYPLTVSVPLVQTSGAAYTLFVANIREGNSYNWNLTTESTFADVVSRVKTLQNDAGSYEDFQPGKTLLMSAVTSTKVEIGTPLTPVFSRGVARVTLNVTLSNSDVTITSVRMRGVSNRIVYADAALAGNGVTGTTIYPVDAALIDYAAVTTGLPTNGQTKTFSWYVPRNQQGVVAASSASKDKTAYAPRNATYFEITATKGGATPSSSVFRVYPGANLMNDFNIEANHAYTVTLNVTDIGTDPADSRVETFADVDYTGHGTPGSVSNSFILNPAPAGGVARTYRIPIDQVNRYWGGTVAGYGNDPANVIGANDNWVVDLIWTDLSTLYSATSSTTAITLVDNNGFGAGVGKGPDQSFVLNVPAGLPAGNFLLGLKKAGGTDYLWSWHFWVTDYRPDSFNKSAIAAGRYTYPVPGGQVERYGSPAAGVDLWTTEYADNVMMDRALGAVEDYFSAAPSAAATKRGQFYYQFGRKDPIPGQSSLAPHGFATAASPVEISESVKYPWVFYIVPGGGNWTNSAGIFATSIVWNDPAATAASKSIYDPCPVGWRLPTNGTWGDFNRQVSGNFVNAQNPARDLAYGYGRGIGSASAPVNGLRYWPGTTATDPVAGTIWYPATGSRHVAAGYLSTVNSNGYYWSDTPRDTATSSYHLGFLPGTIYGNNGGERGYGFAVRCISE
jgi:uncharacterized protein (TIGR02145 family)